MSCAQSVTVSQAPPARANRAPSLAGRWWRAYWDWRAREATIVILRSLDERTLRDIGINASEIASCVYGQGGDRRRAYDESWPWRSRR